MAQSLAAFRRELDVFVDQALGPEGQREIFVAVAREALAEFEAQWRSALAKEPEFERFVDGRLGADLASVRADGVIAERVRPIGPIVDRALELFEIFTKIVTGESKSRIFAFVNDMQTPLGSAEARPGDQVAITMLADWDWKGEVRGFNDKDTSGFSNGLFESVAAILKKEFSGAQTPIRFTGRNFAGRRRPAILIG